MLPSASACWFQVTGRRRVLKPAAFTALISCWVARGLPQEVSAGTASSVLPRFQAGDICCDSWMLVRSRMEPGTAITNAWVVLAPQALVCVAVAVQLALGVMVCSRA